MMAETQIPSNGRVGCACLVRVQECALANAEVCVFTKNQESAFAEVHV